MAENGLTLTLAATSPATPGTAVGATTASNVSLAGYKSLRVEASLLGATGGTLDVYVQVSYDDQATWSDYVHYPQLLAGAGAATKGTSHSRAVGDPMADVGKGLSPTLAAGDWRDGDWGVAARILFVAGSGTTAGAAQSVTLFLSR